MHKIILVACLAAAVLGGCRRESPEYQPMKLGASAQQANVRN